MATHPVSCTTETVEQTCGPFIPCLNNLCQANHVSVVSEFHAINNNAIGDPTFKKDVRCPALTPNF